MFISGGLNDPRVTYWEPAKWAAKLRATRTDDNVLAAQDQYGRGPWRQIGPVIRLADAAYLVWFGIKLLLSARASESAPRRLVSLPATDLAAFRSGLFTNLTNPKAGAFWTSVFSSIFPAHVPAWLFIATGVMVPCISGSWYITLGLLFGSDRVQQRYLVLRRPIDAPCGAILVGLGVSLATGR
jgi:threonine efflux protein